MADIPMDMDALIEAIRAGSRPETLHETEGRKTVFLPGHREHAARVVNVDTEAGSFAPVRKRGVVTVFDAASFNQVLKDNANPVAGNIAVYFDRHPDHPTVVAVMNGNGENGPGWGDYRVQIDFRPTPQWEKWRGYDGRFLQQEVFAEFIEDNMADIVSEEDGTTAADMMEVATYLIVNRSLNFKSGVKLQGGAVQLQHEETDEVKAGTVKVPEIFNLGIRPIFGLASYRVPARFRYRIKDRKLLLGYKLERVETLMEKIVEDVIAKIERGANISVLDGLPPELPSQSRG